MANKKLYQKPEIKQVNLVPEEAVLTFCKVSPEAATLGSGANKCGTGGTNVCKTVGS